MEGLSAIYSKAVVNAVLTPGVIPALTPPLVTAPVLVPVQPGTMPAVYDPAAYGYANPVFVAAMDKYIKDKSDALNAARAAIEAAGVDAVANEARKNNIKNAALGAGAAVILFKFLL